MNQSTKIMFLIGLICNILEIIVCILGIFALAIAVGDSSEIFANLPADLQAQFADVKAFEAWLVSGCVGCVFGLLISIAVLICSRLAKKAQEKGTSPKAWPIVMVVLGALNNIFYLVAGVLCLVENMQQSQPAKIEEAQPAPKKARAKKTEE